MSGPDAVTYANPTEGLDAHSGALEAGFSSGTYTGPEGGADTAEPPVEAASLPRSARYVRMHLPLSALSGVATRPSVMPVSRATGTSALDVTHLARSRDRVW